MICERESIARIADYSAAELLDENIRIRMHRNEPPLMPAEHVLAAIRSVDGELLRTYPTTLSAQVASLLAQRAGVRAESVLLTSGADEALATAARAYAGVGRALVSVRPSFGMYERVAAIAGAPFVAAAYRSRWHIDLAQIASIAKGAAVVVLGHPNNPTGEPLRASDAADLARALPETLLVIDEVYLALSAQSLVPLTEQFGNIAVIGSLSKTAALAGLRIGYIIASPAVVRVLRRALQPFPVCALSLVAARAYLHERESTARFETAVQQAVRASLDRIESALRPLARAFWRGPANFALIDAGERCGAIVNRMRERGIGVRSYAQPELQTCLRVCAASISETEEFIDAYCAAAT